MAINTHFDGAPNVFAPLDDARFDDQPGSALGVGLSRAVIEDTPPIRSVDTLTRDDVHALLDYYSRTSPALTPTDDAAGADGSDGTKVARSEEQLRVSIVSHPAERVRFQEVTVTVRREDLRVIRPPPSL